MNYSIYRVLYGMHWMTHWGLKHLTPAGLGVLFGLIFSGGLGLGSTQSLCHILFFLFLALLLLATIGSRLIQYSFIATRQLPQFGTVGDALRYRVVLHNVTVVSQRGLKFVEELPRDFPPFSEFVQVKKQSALRQSWLRDWMRYLYKLRWAIAPVQHLPVLDARKKTEVTVEILPLRRGRLALDRMTLICPDPLGLVYQRVSETVPGSVCILPKRYQLPPLLLSPRRTRQLGNAVTTSAVGDSLEFRSLREYRPGDPTNKIHWKSWAKIGRPIVREQYDDSVVHHSLILDTCTTQGESERLEAALAVAISFLLQPQPAEDFLDVIFSAPENRCITVGQGLRQRGKILEVLSALDACSTQTFEGLIPVIQSRLPHLSACLCIFTQMTEVHADALAMLTQSNVPTRVLVLCNHQINLESLGCSLSPNCHVHFISIHQIQQDLSQL